MKSLHSEKFCFYICYSFLLFGQQWSREKRETVKKKKLFSPRLVHLPFLCIFLLFKITKIGKSFRLTKLKM